MKQIGIDSLGRIVNRGSLIYNTNSKELYVVIERTNNNTIYVVPIQPDITDFKSWYILSLYNFIAISDNTLLNSDKIVTFYSTKKIAHASAFKVLKEMRTKFNIPEPCMY